MNKLYRGLDNLEVVFESPRVILTYADSGNIVMLSPKYANIEQSRANAEEIAMRCRYHDRLVEHLRNAVDVLYGEGGTFRVSESEALLAELSAHNGGEE